ncbi:putative DCC family thiol-disulfide oxidoreductase YuxK [Roseovarius sp. MBR-79]|jgi:predicted DCC family thiol-disulfide oxidoreductase YuxK
MTTAPHTRALFNGDCPVCKSEMAVYEGYAARAALPIAFDDLNRTDLDRWGVTEDEAARLLHVLHEGRLHVGFDAFLVLWDQMPRYRWLARIGRVPGVCHLCRWGYTHIVARIIYARHKRRQARARGCDA